MAEQRTLLLDGLKVVFPDGKAYCLVCGATPSGTRRVWFENLASANPNAARLGDKVHGLGVGLSVIRSRVEFEAPLCSAHRRAAVLLSLKAIGLMLLALAVLVGSIVVLKHINVPKAYATMAEWAPFVPALFPGIVAGVLWMRKDRGGLTCEVSLEEGSLVLHYPDRAPVPSGS